MRYNKSDAFEVRYLWRRVSRPKLTGQGSHCAICGTVALDGKAWHIDHDHTTGVVRGILCPNCNLGLGVFQDDTSRLASAISYLHHAARPADSSTTGSV